MEGLDPRRCFGPQAAPQYDARSVQGDEEETAAFLHARARGGPALEFAIGTGRIALPLARRGTRVDGIDLSEAMVGQLRAKPGGTDLDVRIGDMSTLRLRRSYALVYLVFNTIGNLLTQDEQVRCFQNAAAHLAPAGEFVLECRVPDAPARPGHPEVGAEHVGTDQVVLGVRTYDPVTQIIDEQHVSIGANGITLTPISLRLAGAAEFDLMARLAGLRLVERFGGWNGEPFTPASWRHVSVYGPG
jgi:SAM-dependent methyltransferase